MRVERLSFAVRVIRLTYWGRLEAKLRKLRLRIDRMSHIDDLLENQGMTIADPSTSSDDQALLLSSDSGSETKRPTPLPKLQISVLVLSGLVDAVASQYIYPFINQVRMTCHVQVGKN
jgi:hypothetical protein